MAKKQKRVFQGKRLFTPSVVRRFSQSTGLLKRQTQAELSGSAPGETTSSFRYDPAGSPLKSDQQLPVDFSRWENHTFFSSAESNVNVAFEKIINNFPFDGSRKAYEDYLDSLSGYERYILDERYPSYTGYLTLTSSHITVKDKAGSLFPSISRIKTGQSVLDPKGKSFSVEAFIGIPAQANGKQTIFYHTSGSTDVGYAVYIENDAGVKSADLKFTCFSGSAHITATHSFSKGQFAPLSFVFDNSPNQRMLRIVSGTTTVARSKRFKFNYLTTNGGPLVIGSGSAITRPSGVNFTPTQTFSGSIKRINIYETARSIPDIKSDLHKTIFANDGLKLSLRMNEATGSYTNNDVVLDHSGNSLHSTILNYTAGIRSQRPFLDPIKFEKIVAHPTLFPSHQAVVNLNTQLLYTASMYDVNNPNLITKLIPDHYLTMAAQEGTISDDPNGSLRDGINQPAQKYSAPGGARFGQPQIISSLLFVWAKEFDKVKMMLDQVSELVFVDYEEEGWIADQFLPHLSEYYGFELPAFFNNATPDQIFDGTNVYGDAPTSKSLQKVQALIWRRILKEVKEIISSKGTVHSIKTLFRSAGIDPDRMFRFVEFGGVNDLRLGESRQNITEISTMLDFSGSLVMGTGSFDVHGRKSTMPTFRSTFLSSSRIETGRPLVQGSMVDKTLFSPHGISNNQDDGLLTSGSWSYEGRYRFPVVLQSGRPQSLIRVHASSSDFPRHGNEEPLLLNLVASKPAFSGSSKVADLTLYARPGFGATDSLLSLVLTGSNIFNGDRWYVACGREDPRDKGTNLKANYFITVARQEFGEIKEYYHTSSFFQEATTAGLNAFQKKYDTAATAGAKKTSRLVNSSGSFLCIGSQSIGTGSNLNFLNNKTYVTNDFARYSHFDGRMGHMRFWSKPLSEKEKKEHIKSFVSLGVESPTKNFGFTPDVTGSFEKLRLDVSTDQPVTSSNSKGRLQLTDFSQTFTDSISGGTLAGFDEDSPVTKPERFDFSIISPRYDQPSSTNKVRIHGFTQGENLSTFGGLPGPTFEIEKQSAPVDDARFAIEFSMMQALDEDIMKIFATMDSLDNIIGGPEMMFAEEYPGLRDLRDMYFNRLTGAVNYKQFFELFRWLDAAFNDIIEDLIPRKTNYLGFNFIVEPHALERAKVVYGSGDVYLGESLRRNLKGQLLLRQLVAEVKKF